MQLETVVCTICDNTEYNTILHSKSLYSEDLFPLVKCTQCSLMYINPRMSTQEVFEIYTNLSTKEYYKDLWNKRYGEGLALLRRYVLPNYPWASSILEIGSGTGAMLSAAEKLGFKDLWGIEPNTEACEIANQENPHFNMIPNIDVCNEKQMEAIEKKFDVIFSYHTFEHLPNPKIALLNAVKLLNENGAIIVAVPNTGTAEFRKLQKEKIDENGLFDPSAHIYHFTIDSLYKLFTSAKLRVVSIEGVPNNPHKNLRFVNSRKLQILSGINKLIEKIAHNNSCTILAIGMK